MQSRHCDHYRRAVTVLSKRAAHSDIIRRLADYALGYADRQAEQRR
jgi:hypothetical protein